MGGKDRFGHDPQTMPDCFRPWDGRADIPSRVGLTDVVDVWFRIGRASVRPLQAQRWSWRHTGSTGDVVGWCFPAENSAGVRAISEQGNLPPDDPKSLLTAEEGPGGTAK